MKCRSSRFSTTRCCMFLILKSKELSFRAWEVLTSNGLMLINKGMKILFRLGVFLLFCSSAFAGLTLVNDSTYKLTVQIRAADGTDLGSLEINPQHTMAWNTFSGTTGNIQYYNSSQTPYTVIWFCNNGSTDSPYSI